MALARWRADRAAGYRSLPAGGGSYVDSASLSRSDTTNATQIRSATGSRSTGTSSSLQTGPLPVQNGLGKPIGPEHGNYELMRSIQRGIRHGIGRQTSGSSFPSLTMSMNNKYVCKHNMYNMYKVVYICM